MKEMVIGGLLITLPGLVALAFAVLFVQNLWMVLAIVASVSFTALPFLTAILLLRSQHRREGHDETQA
jgi:membrane protein implicated in regulation of membrane protease activity